MPYGDDTGPGGPAPGAGRHSGSDFPAGVRGPGFPSGTGGHGFPSGTGGTGAGGPTGPTGPSGPAGGGMGAIAGYRLTGRYRNGDAGVWVDAIAPDGVRAGALRLDPGALAIPGARERVVAAVTADRRLGQSGLGGLMPIDDLVAARDEIWLLTGRPGTPSLEELMNGRPGSTGPDAGSAATVLVETAQTLLAVHAAGLSHGALRPGTVVIGEDGATVLAERGLAEALRGEPNDARRDVAAWAVLARALTASWAAGDPRAAQLFERAAATASTHGLGAARDTLLEGRDLLPSGFTTRERLVRTIQWWSAGDAPTHDPSPAHGFAADSGEVVTLLYQPGTSSGTYGAPGAYGAAGAAGAAAGLGAAGTVPAGGSAASTVPAGGQASGEGMRFGPGVPADTAAAQIWRSGRDQMTVSTKDRASRPRKRRRGGVLGSGLIFLLILAAALYLWFQRGDPLAVSAVDVRAPKPKGCDVTLNVVGVITTNGSAGEVTYEWLPTGRKPIRHTDTVESGKTSHQVSLEWEIGGEGTKKLTARLRVLSPIGDQGPLEDKATFTYRC
ncbi:hypothetical protein [Sphaerisporangium aureirubrum]|uniref:Ig-like domain-containing protein n=1 Tax=Sphaerisporangium aureirubrum TaxID=1544736 RepID=A0ABW1NN14_9ACTN